MKSSPGKELISKAGSPANLPLIKAVKIRVNGDSRGKNISTNLYINGIGLDFKRKWVE